MLQEKINGTSSPQSVTGEKGGRKGDRAELESFQKTSNLVRCCVLSNILNENKVLSCTSLVLLQNQLSLLRLLEVIQKLAIITLILESQILERNLCFHEEPN